MKKRDKRDPNEWTKVDVKKETRRKLNIRKQKEELKNIDELINKLLKLKKR